MLCWTRSGHSRTSLKPPEKGIEGQRKFLTDFSTHLVWFKALDSNTGQQQKWELWEETIQLVVLPGQEANSDGETEPSPGTRECVLSLRGAAPGAGSSC